MNETLNCMETRRSVRGYEPDRVPADELIEAVARAGTFAPIASFSVLETAVAVAREQGLPFHVGNLLTSDRFYGDDAGVPEALTANAGWKKMGVLAIEMEAAALYMNAARYGKKALAICTVSDHILTGEATTAQERQTSFTDMMRLALETARRLEAQP